MSISSCDLSSLVPVVNSISKGIYYKPQFSSLRRLYELEDYQQSVFYKLLYRDNYKRYSEEYKLTSFIFRVAKSVALQLSMKKNEEYTVLTEDKNDESPNTIKLDRVSSVEFDFDPDVEFRINKIMASMPEEEVKSVYIKMNDQIIPFSVENMFKVFVEHKLEKKEMEECIFNHKNGKQISKPTFNKYWNYMLCVIRCTIRSES